MSVPVNCNFAVRSPNLEIDENKIHNHRREDHSVQAVDRIRFDSPSGLTTSLREKGEASWSL